MKIWHDELAFPDTSPLMDSIFTESVIFFDIETTGFSPTHSSLYLIGCGVRRADRLIIDQFFAEDPSEEREALLAFLDYLAPYETILSFNGLGFDIPYLQGKCAAYKVADLFSSYNYLDIFKEVSRLKFLLKLENYKQKTIERFLGINRDDAFDGGMLIEVYHNYVKSKDSQAEALLKLHNYEDVRGMTDLLSILSYSRFFQGDFTLADYRVQTYENYDHTETGEEMLFSLSLLHPVPKRVSCRFEDCYLSLFQGSASLCVKIKNDTLKYFFPNYRDYYYLPHEDKAIHKSVAAFVEKEYREKAKAANCYQRKEGRFLPQYEEVFTPAFRTELKDKTSYFELTDAFFHNREFQENYIKHLISMFSSAKKQGRR